MPRLTINKEEWKGREDGKKEEEGNMDDNQEEALESGGSAWDLSRCSEKRRKKEGGGKRSKRRKLELLVGWGEGNDNLQDEIMEEWVVREEILEDASMETRGMEVNIQPTNIAPKSDRFKQREVSFSKKARKKIAKMGEGIKEEENPSRKKKISKDDQIRLAAVGSGNIQNWMTVGKKVNLENLEWDDDPDLPSLEEIDVIEKRESRRVEDKEHGFLDSILEEEGVVIYGMTQNIGPEVTQRAGPACGAGLTDWEQDANRELDKLETENISLNATNLNITMSMYLTNTNLINKRMMCSTSSVEPNTSKSESGHES